MGNGLYIVKQHHKISSMFSRLCSWIQSWSQNINQHQSLENDQFLVTRFWFKLGSSESTQKISGWQIQRSPHIIPGILNSWRSTNDLLPHRPHNHCRNCWVHSSWNWSVHFLFSYTCPLPSFTSFAFAFVLVFVWFFILFYMLFKFVILRVVVLIVIFLLNSRASWINGHRDCWLQWSRILITSISPGPRFSTVFNAWRQLKFNLTRNGSCQQLCECGFRNTSQWNINLNMMQRTQPYRHPYHWGFSQPLTSWSGSIVCSKNFWMLIAKYCILFIVGFLVKLVNTALTGLTIRRRPVPASGCEEKGGTSVNCGESYQAIWTPKMHCRWSSALWTCYHIVGRLTMQHIAKRC